MMGQQKEDKEIKLNEETVKLIQFDFLPGDMENYNKPLKSALDKLELGITEGQPIKSFYVFQQVYDENGKPIEGTGAAEAELFG